MIKLTIFWVVIGLIVFTSMAMFDAQNWLQAYALWDKGKDVLLIFLAYQVISKEFKPLLFFALVRLLWEPVSWITGLSVNNSYAVGIFFLIYLSYVCYKTSTDVRN